MTINVKVGEAKTHLSELLAKVEAGEEVVISRGKESVARLVKIEKHDDVRQAVQEILAARRRNGRVTVEEILAWRDEGRRY